MQRARRGGRALRGVGEVGQPTYRAPRPGGCYLNWGIRAGISGPRHPAENGATLRPHYWESQIEGEMRVRKLLTLAAVVAAFAAVASPANAVFYGEPDGNAHPYVGLMVAMDANNTPLWRCTGTQISPTVFLTAGHCVFGAAKAMVWFDSGRPAGYPRTGGFVGTPIPNPGYDEFATFPNTSDVGVVK